MGAPDSERARPRGRPPDSARTRRGRLRLDKLDPLLPGGKRMTPPPLRCLCSPRAATLCCTNLCARPLLCTHRRRRGLRGGAASSPALPFLLLFFFCIWKREQCSILPYLCFYSGTNVGCVRVCFPVGFLKKWEEKNPPLSSLSPHSVLLTPLLPPFFLFFFFLSVLFCYESTFLFVILGSPRFLFSVKSPYASSALRLLLPSSRPNSLGGAWPAPFPLRLCPFSLRRGSRRLGGAPHIWCSASAI